MQTKRNNSNFIAKGAIMNSNLQSGLRALVFFLVIIFIQNPLWATTSYVKTERMAAYQDTQVMVDEVTSNIAILTYRKDANILLESYMLAKLVTGLDEGNLSTTSGEIKDLEVEDFPGGVRAKYSLGDIRINCMVTPLLAGRDTDTQEGSALIRITTHPSRPVVVHCGGRETFNLLRRVKDREFRRSETLGDKVNTIEFAGNLAILTSAIQPLDLAVRSDGQMSSVMDKEGKKRLTIHFEKGKGNIIIAFGEDKPDAERLAQADFDAEYAKVRRYYATLLESRIETPDKDLNDAFRSAIYNLEYNWLAPYGWIECIHHWLAIWHQQHIGGVEWLGQSDRAEMCIRSLADRIFDNGDIPNLYANGEPFTSFGGTNQYFAWEVLQHWNFTADRTFAKEMCPVLDRVIDRTFKHYDPEADLLLCWGQQIGNQEDYVDTPGNGTSPTVEGINMMRTRMALAAALDEPQTVTKYQTKIARAKAALRQQLWKQDLGRFLYYRDSHDNMHLDGQYHTFIYPVIYGILDRLDSWTSIRHLRDRLIGTGGEVYCSNNFPTHLACTCGPQSGAAQQPWGAWGLSAMGLRNETYRPLKAVARWVTCDQQRGSWPEVSPDHKIPAYFSPPIGLFVQATVEALFGLQLNKPGAVLKIAPSFPDHWPSAQLHLPAFLADYRRRGNTLSYTVESDQPLARQVRWLLAPSRIEAVLVNGKEVAYETMPDVGCILLSFDTSACTKTEIVIKANPINYDVRYPASIAESDTLSLRSRGCKITGIDDRCGVLAETHFSDTNLRGQIRSGLLSGYRKFGRLGMMNFARRSFFIYCDAGEGLEFWQPVDITVLPRYEAAAKGQIKPGESGGRLNVVLRNNTFSRLQGRAFLQAAQSSFGFAVDVPGRAEKQFSVTIPHDLLALLSPGDNQGQIILPSGDTVDFTFTATELFTDNEVLREYAGSRNCPIDLPEEALVEDTQWRSLREFYAYGHQPWASTVPPLKDLKAGLVTVPGLPVEFEIPERRIVPVSFRFGQNCFTLSLGGQPYRKLYLLVVPFLDNHNVFSTVGRITLTRNNGRLIDAGVLHFPGDVDWASPEEIVGGFATARKPRPRRYGLLPLLKPGDKDWPQAKPAQDGFPQPEYWASSRVFKTPSSVMNVIELDLGRFVELKSLSFSTIGTETAFALVAVTGEGVGDMQMLEGTKWAPPARFQPPVTIFSIEDANSAKDWRFEGDAFSVAAVPALFARPTLNSLAKSGETATGKVTSPDFVLNKNYKTLKFFYQGGTSSREDGPGLLCIDLVDSETNERLIRYHVQASHPLRWGRIDIEKWAGRTVHLELTDKNTNPSYAWLGIQRVTLSPDK